MKQCGIWIHRAINHLISNNLDLGNLRIYSNIYIQRSKSHRNSYRLNVYNTRDPVILHQILLEEAPRLHNYGSNAFLDSGNREASSFATLQLESVHGHQSKKSAISKPVITIPQAFRARKQCLRSNYHRHAHQGHDIIKNLHPKSSSYMNECYGYLYIYLCTCIYTT